MTQTVVECPSMNLKFLENTMPSLLDSGSMVSLVQSDYFDHFIQLKLEPTKGPEANVHNLFKLKKASEGGIPITHCFEMDVNSYS